MRKPWERRSVLGAAGPAVLVLAGSVVAAQGAEPTHGDVRYHTKYERSVLDLWTVEGGKPAPLVVMFHGGGFKQGDKSSWRKSPFIRDYHPKGVAFAAVNYPFLEHAGDVRKILEHTEESMRSRSALARGLFAWAGLAPAVYAADVAPPPNAPAAADWDAGTGRLSLRYRDAVLFEAAVGAEDAGGRKVEGVAVRLEEKEAGGEKVEQGLKFVQAAPRDGVVLVLRGVAVGSDEAFPAETPSEAQKRFPCVRNSVGLSRNRRNNAVYDRRWDWVLAGPGDGGTRIRPAGQKEGGHAFTWESRGPALELAFRPRYYQKHLGYAFFEPWTYRIWTGSLTGYCTWWAYRGGFTQEVLDGMLKVFVEKRLPDFGYDYMQLDDCYQKGNGSAPWNWLNWNEKKYPGGWKKALTSIRDAGMKPGIWVHRVHRPNDPGVKEIIETHPDWFVPGADGKPHHQNGFCSLNTLNPEAVETMIRPLYRGLAEQGWAYVKIDGTGDLLRAYQNKNCAKFFQDHSVTPEQSLRAWDTIARKELGPEVYLLACHTVANARHVVGLVDGARLSNDGFQPDALAQYNNLEGVLWRNDPDHCDVLGMWLMDEDARMPVFGLEAPVPARTVIRPAVCAMAGGVLMVSDTMEVYRDDRNIEGMKRSAPVLSTVPGQLYDCGRRTVPWWLQEIDRPFDHWSVLARFQWGEPKKEEKKQTWALQGAPAQEVQFADLGLEADRAYVVCEFWGQKGLGTFTGSFTAPAMDEHTVMHVFAIREARPHPWVVSTTRHITQGGVSLLDVAWDDAGQVLAGKSAVVAGDPYALTVHLPAGWTLAGAEIGGGKAETAGGKGFATVRVVPSATKTVEWKMTFAR